jgi:hypothetical protein
MMEFIGSVLGLGFVSERLFWIGGVVMRGRSI